MKSLETKVYIKPVDCFKPQRFCDQTNDTMPYDVYEEVDFSIPQSIFIGTTIEIYNQTENVYINLTDLNAGSTNIFEAYWNLTYEHGSGIGYGSLKINCTFEIVDDILKIQINLDYIYYRIRPFYKSGEFIAYVHPDYTYSIIN